MSAPSHRRRLVLFALCALASPLVVEGAVRARAWMKYGAHRDVYELTHELPGIGLRAVRPNLSVEFARRARIETDSRGFRSPEVRVPKPPGTVRLAFLGGSTTFCGQASSNAATWPALVRDRLAEAWPDVAFDHVNAGVTGASVEDSRLALEHRVRAVEPDVVVVLHAAKDLADDTRALAHDAGITVEPAGGAKGWLERHSEAWRLLRLNLWFLRSQARGASGEGKLAFGPDALACGFAERVATLSREAGEVADLVVLVTFATKVRSDQPRDVQLENLRQAFTFMPYLTPEGILDGYDAYNRAIARAAEATGALLVAGHGAIPATGEYFSDSVHFTERGYEAMAERIASAIVASASFRALVEQEVQR